MTGLEFDSWEISKLTEITEWITANCKGGVFFESPHRVDRDIKLNRTKYRLKAMFYDKNEALMCKLTWGGR